MENYELAFRVQMEVPGMLNTDDASQQTLDRFGIGTELTDN